MKRIVLDASAALAFVLPDEPLHERAVARLSQLAATGFSFCAPALFAYECDAVLCLRVHKGALTTTQAQLARAALDALGVAVEYDAADHDRAFEIAREYSQPRCYDAAYAAHAQSRRLDLLTADEKFFQAVTKPKKALHFVRAL